MQCLGTRCIWLGVELNMKENIKRLSYEEFWQTYKKEMEERIKPKKRILKKPIFQHKK